MPIHRSARALAASSFAGLALACAPAVTTRAPAPSPAPQPVSSPGAAAALGAVHWVRSAAEHRALLIQIYRNATAELERQAAGLARGSWGVILDADETVLDNSTYQKERAELGLGFSDSSWTAWVKREEATALPGAGEFIQRARALGGHVVIVTNRDEPTCPATRANFRKVGIAVDAVLCRVDRVSDKNPRFQAVSAGTATPDLPPLRVLMWVGDNIQDFPALSQELRTAPDSAFAPFGRSYWVLPNPMYGSWERNPPR